MSAEIFDQGYRRFEGDRTGVVGSVRSLAWHTTRSILGLGRKARHKVFPVIVIVISFLPSIIFIGVAALLPIDMFGDELRPEYWELAQTSGFAILLFCAMVVPEALVRDRRDGMFGLYLSTPLTKTTYLLGKVLAVMGVLTLVTVLPALLLLLGVTFEGVGPDGFLAWLGTAGQIIVAGVGISAVLAGVGFAAASLTDRRAFASVAAAMVFIGTPIVTSVLIDTADMSETVRLFDVINMAFEFSPRVFGDRSGDFVALSNFQVLGGDALWLLAGFGTMVYRYRRLAAV